jgi:hypothetical protein
MVALVTAGACFLKGHGTQKVLGVVPLALWLVGFVMYRTSGGESVSSPFKFIAHALVVLAAFSGVFLIYWGVKGGFRPPRVVKGFKNYR